MSPPVSSLIVETAVIHAPLAKVWDLIQLSSFSSWWTSLSSSSETELAFKDGTTLSVKQEEYSAIDHFITYSVVSSSHELAYSSAVSKIALTAVTTGESAGATVVSWSGNFSSDADASVIQDARYKRQEALADLAKYAK